MRNTRHVLQRMSQRGVNREMLELVLDHGDLVQDKYILGRRDAVRLAESLRHQLRVLMKIVDKGGVTVVAADGMLITTYNCNQPGEGH